MTEATAKVAAEVRREVLEILGYSCETCAPNSQPTTEYITDRWMRPRLDALVEYILEVAKHAGE